MARYHTTSEGNVAYTAAEETARDAEETAWTEGADDRAAVEVRKERDSLIAATDYYALTDVTMNSSITAYRQALRDVPAQDGFPNTITWPTKP